MDQPILFALIAALTAGVTTNLLVPLAAKAAIALGAVDHPGGRKHQTEAIPRLGGLAIAVGLAVAAGIVTIFQWEAWEPIIDKRQTLALILGASLVFLVGFVDDLIDISAAKKFLFQVLAAILLVRVGWSFEVVRLFGLGEVDLGLFGAVVSVVWIVGVSNAIILIDGLDGLAGGVVTIISLSLLAFSVGQGNPVTVILMSATAGSCIGFLRHNWTPARIFMGDSGSLTLGFLLAAASVQSSLKTPTAVAILAPVLALGVPVIDTLLVMSVRFLRRSKGTPATRFLQMFKADRNHLHHMLGHLNTSRPKVVGAIYIVVLLFCVASLVVALVDDPTLGLLVAGIEVFVIFFIRRRGRKAAAQHLDDTQNRHLRDLV